MGIDKMMPSVSRSGGGGRVKKKQGVIDKLNGFFEKYFGIGGSVKFIEPHITPSIGIQQENVLCTTACDKCWGGICSIGKK